MTACRCAALKAVEVPASIESHQLRLQLRPKRLIHRSGLQRGKRRIDAPGECERAVEIEVALQRLRQPIVLRAGRSRR